MIICSQWTKKVLCAGGSGSGKTTLLDVIAARHSGGLVEGEIMINNKPRTKELMKDIRYLSFHRHFLMENSGTGPTAV